MNTRTRARRKIPAQAKRGTRTRRAKISPSYQKYRATGLSDLIPAATYTTLRYTDPNTIRLATGTNWNLFTLRANDPWDPDTALGSAAVSGFREFANFYQKWRVLKVRVEWEVINQSNAPISLYVNYAADVNIIPSNYAAAVSFGDNPQSSVVKSVAQSATGFNKTKVIFNFDIARSYGGGGEYIANENFVGNGGASPASPASRTYLNFVGFSNGNMTQGVYSRITIKYYTHFFDRIPLVT